MLSIRLRRLPNQSAYQKDKLHMCKGRNEWRESWIGCGRFIACDLTDAVKPDDSAKGVDYI